MNYFLRIAAAGFVFSALASSSSAALYECHVTKSNDIYIPEVIAIDFNESTGEVLVNDPLIQHFIGHAINGELATENNQRTTFRWAINGTKAGVQQRVDLRYRATIMKGSKKLVVSGKPLGYTNTFRGDGHCKVK